MRPVGCIHATRSGADGHYGRTLVVLAVEECLNLHVSKVGIQGFDLPVGLRQDIPVVLLAPQLLQGLHIIQPAGG